MVSQEDTGLKDMAIRRVCPFVGTPLHTGNCGADGQVAAPFAYFVQ